jgi:DNA helicase HerA-like ATPase
LTLGWRVTDAFEPKYWLNPHAKPSFQSNDDLVEIPSALAGAHTVIIAQSGSGKSFFLGRLLEELSLQTKARCLIMDPNGDFTKVYETRDEKLWDKAEYDQVRGSPMGLPHEKNRKEFADKWSAVPISVKTRRPSNPKYHELLTFWWPSLSMDLLAEEIEPILRSELTHCHDFVKTLAELAGAKVSGKMEPKRSLIDDAERLMRLGRSLSQEDFYSILEREYGSGSFVSNLLTRFLGRESALDRLRRAPGYISDSVARFYFGKAREYQALGILQNAAPAKSESAIEKRLEVVDLPSLTDRKMRLLAINALVTTEWDKARDAWTRALEQPSGDDTRTPTFVIVEEAHNVIPVEPRDGADAALRDQFRTIAAEGRKYGLFLILISQRPDKLDPFVVSECENKALMRVGSNSVLDQTCKLLAGC